MAPSSVADVKSNIGVFLKVIFWGILIYFCLVFVIPQWQSLHLTDRLRSISPAWLIAAGALIVAHYFMIFASWLMLLRMVGSRPSVLEAFRAFSLALLPKYIPGKVISHGVRARLALQAGVPTAAISSSFIWEAVLALGSAAFIGLVGLIYWPMAALREASGWLVLAFVIGALAFAAVGSSRLLGSRWSVWIGFPQLAKQPQALAGVFALYLATWVMVGLSHWCLANAVTPLPAGTIPGFTVALAVSWGVAFISIIAPGGLGVREGVLYLYALNWLSAPHALLFVTISRLALFVVEGLLTGSWALLALYRSGRSLPARAADG